VYYVSPGQVNVQVPADLPSGAVPVVVAHNGRSSEPVNLEIKERAGGLLAPASFKVGDKQYAAALHASGGFVSNGSIPNVGNAPAVPGETLVFYGIGFGPVTPTVQPGQVASGDTAVLNRVEFFFGDTPAEVRYAGLTPESVGLYQFNVVVPGGVPSGDVQLRVLSGGEPIAQALWVPVQ
jgi:uncharacterized protein (TIGR03437 family)